MVLRGTKKFLDRAGPPVRSEMQSSGVLDDWYATVWFWRPQVALFVNATTLLPVLAVGATSSLISRLPAAFAEVATRLGVEPSAIDTRWRRWRPGHSPRPRAVACSAS